MRINKGIAKKRGAHKNRTKKIEMVMVRAFFGRLKAKHFRVGLFCLLNVALEALDPLSFYVLLNEPAPEWMSEQIQHDLAPFHKELSRKFLDELFADESRDYLPPESPLRVRVGHCLARVKVVDGILTVESSKCASAHGAATAIIPHIYQLHAIIPIPDIDFVLTSNDMIHCRHIHPTEPDPPALPIFVTSKCKLHDGNILMPDWFAFKDYAPDKSLVLEGNNIYPWDTKRKILFFRGGDTGTFDWDNWRSFPRPKLVALSIKYPELIDAKFVISLHNMGIFETVKKEGFIGNFVSMRDNPSYRYLLDVDGNCASCPRTALSFHSNSVVFKQMTNSMQWFYRTLKPNTHFIPVAEDFSDIFTQLEWAKNNDEECKKISENARALAKEVLTEERVFQYFYLLLREYAKKQKPLYDLE